MKSMRFITSLTLVALMQIGVVFFAPLSIGADNAFAFTIPHDDVRADCFTEDEQKQMEAAGFVRDSQMGYPGYWDAFINPNSIPSGPYFLNAKERREYNKLITPHQKKIALVLADFVKSAQDPSDPLHDDWLEGVRHYAKDTGRPTQEYVDNEVPHVIRSRGDTVQCADSGGLIWEAIPGHGHYPVAELFSPAKAGICNAACDAQKQHIKMTMRTPYFCCCTAPPKKPEILAPPKKCGVMNLQVPIVNIGSEIKLCDCKDDVITKCDGIATYITVIFKWLVRFAIILSILIIIIAGFRLLFARGNAGTIAEVKKMLTNVCIGLIFALGSYTLLSAINPKLTLLTSVEPTVIQGIDPNTYTFKNGINHVKLNNSQCPHPELNREREDKRIMY